MINIALVVGVNTCIVILVITQKWKFNINILIMKQTVEEAAYNYLQKILESSDFEINFEEDNYDAGARDAVLDVTERAYIAGANWRINSVWHDASERPDKGKMLIVEDIDSAYDLVYLTKSKPWEELSEKNHYMRWAYIEDLLPNMED